MMKIRPTEISSGSAGRRTGPGQLVQACAAVKGADFVRDYLLQIISK